MTPFDARVDSFSAARAAWCNPHALFWFGQGKRI
jgi:hypothetical protein